MKKFKVLVNTRTSGKFHREQIDGRSHIVTTMMPIRGDITMNKKFYPDEQVTNSFMQLNMLPAPHGHPTVNGVSVPAFHPVANNKHNMGGFLRNPRKKGKRVFVDFMLDEEVANNSEEGKETIRRIEAGEKIGVSTGLTIDMVINKKGKDDFGKEFDQEVSGFNFDHVAILLNEAAAGEHAGTELVLNEEGETIHVSNLDLECNEVSTSEMHESLEALIRSGVSKDTFSWVRDVFPESKTFIFSVDQTGQDLKHFKQSFAIDQNDVFSLLGDRKEVIKNPEKFIDKPEPTFNKDEDQDMDKLSVILAIIGNSANTYVVSDKDKLMAMSDADLNQIISTNTDEAGAKAILTNSGFDFAGYEAYTTNKSAFEAFQASEETKLTELKTTIVANSEYTAEMLTGKTRQELTIINSMAKPVKHAARIPEGGQTHIQINSADDAGVVDYS